MLVEAALVLPFLVVLVLGVVEFGVLWRNENVLASSLRTSSRSAAQAMNNPQSDRLALQAFMGSIAGAKNVTVKKVIIFKVDESTNPNGDLPTSCKNKTTTTTGPNGVQDVCNIFVAQQLTTANLVAANFGCGSSAYDKFFCPTTARSAALPATPTTVGVWAEVESKTSTGILKVAM